MPKIRFTNIHKIMDQHDKVREQLIREARKIIRTSKTAIGSVHRDELKESEKLVSQMKDALENLRKVASKNTKLFHEGIFKVAVQEYVEAFSLLEFVKTGKLIPYSEDYVDPEYYLMGLCDLGGELVRKGINASIKENYSLVTKIRNFIDELYTELSKFDFKNGELRRKYDGMKYDVKKLDDVVFQLKMKDKI